LPPKGWANNNAAGIGAAAWEAAGLVFLAAAIPAVAVIPAADIQAVVEVTPVAEVIRAAGDIRLMAAKGDIPTMTLAAVAVRGR
jgi:hypothetical protein